MERGVELGLNRKIGFALNRSGVPARVGWLHFSHSCFTFYIKQAACGVFYIILT
jgi:hypothetical protein